MTPLQLARAECANMLPDGGCLGVWLHDGGIPYCAPRPVCRLTVGTHQCEYFRRFVLPIADQASPPDDPGLQARRMKARQTYLDMLDLPEKDEPKRTCPDCGEVLAKRQRVCNRCQRKHRQAAAREAMRKSRAAVST